MSAAVSESRLSGVFEDDAAFAAEISAKMRVPKRIQVTGEGDDEFEVRPAPLLNGSPAGAAMTVPDRIVVLGGERHGAGGGPPRELLLERAAGSDAPPPAALRVASHLLPPADDGGAGDEWPERRRRPERSLVLREPLSPPAPPGYLAPAEELEMLRRQLLKVNRRLVQIEVENQRRRSREVMLYTFGAAYLVVKIVLWMGRL